MSASDPSLPSYDQVRRDCGTVNAVMQTNSTIKAHSPHGSTKEAVVESSTPMTRAVVEEKHTLSAAQQLGLLILINLITAVVDYYVFWVALTESDPSASEPYELVISNQGEVIQKPVLTSHNPIVLLVILLLIWTVFVLVMNMMAVIASFQGRTLGDVFRSRR